MADITKCEGIGCSVAQQCYRYTSISADWQSYFAHMPSPTGRQCEYFIQKPKSEIKMPEVEKPKWRKDD